MRILCSVATSAKFILLMGLISGPYHAQSQSRSAEDPHRGGGARQLFGGGPPAQSDAARDQLADRALEDHPGRRGVREGSRADHDQARGASAQLCASHSCDARPAHHGGGSQSGPASNPDRHAALETWRAIVRSRRKDCQCGKSRTRQFATSCRNVCAPRTAFSAGRKSPRRLRRKRTDPA